MPLPEAHFTEEEERYLIRSSADIAYILRRAAEKAAMVTAYFGDGSDFALTAFLDVAPELNRLVFDLPAQRSQASKLVAGGRITFVTNQEGVKIKFQVEGATATEHEGRPALASPMPVAVLRLQRREFYRAPCPLSNPVICAIPYTSQGAAHSAEMVVLDVSLGGIAILDQHHELSLEQGRVYENCAITFPEVGYFSTTLEVRNTQQVTLKNGMVTVRSGCKFIEPPAAGIALVQKYTMKLERQRSSRFERG